jgi:hypothetical protein
VCRGNARVLWLLRQVCVVGNSARGLGGDLGVGPFKSRRGLRILGRCVPLYRWCVSCITSSVLKNRTLHYVELCCNLRTYCNNSILSGICVCDVLLCIVTPIMMPCDDPGETEHPYLRVGCHIDFFWMFHLFWNSLYVRSNTTDHWYWPFSYGLSSCLR